MTLFSRTAPGSPMPFFSARSNPASRCHHTFLADQFDLSRTSVKVTFLSNELRPYNSIPFSLFCENSLSAHCPELLGRFCHLRWMSDTLSWPGTCTKCANKIDELTRRNDRSHSTAGRLAEHEIDEIWWNMMKYDEIWWNMMKYDEIRWNMMKWHLGLQLVAWPTSETVQVPENYCLNASLQNLREPCSLLEFDWRKISLSGPRSDSPCA